MDKTEVGEENTYEGYERYSQRENCQEKKHARARACVAATEIDHVHDRCPHKDPLDIIPRLDHICCNDESFLAVCVFSVCNQHTEPE